MYQPDLTFASRVILTFQHSVPHFFSFVKGLTPVSDYCEDLHGIQQVLNNCGFRASHSAKHRVDTQRRFVGGREN